MEDLIVRQVPLKDRVHSKAFSCYGLVGSGKLAGHLAYYLDLLHLPYVKWHRHLKISISKAFKSCSHILIPIADSEIESFIKNHQDFLFDKICIHFSGSLFTPFAIGTHPLMAFTQNLYSEEIYKKIHFVIDCRHPFKKILPGFPNTHSTIERSQKAQYHALCVIAGLSPLLWQIFFKEIKNFGISKSYALPYFHQVLSNIAHLNHSFTGPLERNDLQTIDSNLKALKDKPKLYDLYRAFLKLKELL